MELKRNCPSCNKLQIYANYSALYKANRYNKVCKSCCRKGRVFSNEHINKLKNAKIGQKQSPSHVVNNSASQKKRYTNPEQRRITSQCTKKALNTPDIRKRHIDALSKIMWLGKAFDLGQKELLEKWNRLGFKFESNYQIHTPDFLCYLDGYDKKHNIVLEYDSKYHSKPSQKQKDLERQRRIIDILHPKKFWRYDAVNKQVKNIIGE